MASEGAAAAGMCVVNCGRPAADGFPTCCQTCKDSSGRHHGPRCTAAAQGRAGQKCLYCDRFAAEGFSTCCRSCLAMHFQGLFLPEYEGGKRVLVATEDDGKFLVDTSGASPGVTYRKSKNLDDLHPKFVMPCGKTVAGVLRDGWLEVSAQGFGGKAHGHVCDLINMPDAPVPLGEGAAMPAPAPPAPSREPGFGAPRPLRAPEEVCQKPTTFESSHYKQFYARETACVTVEGFWDAAARYLIRFYEFKGMSEGDAQLLAQRFTKELKDDVRSVAVGPPRPGDASDIAAKLLTEPSLVCVRCWTSAVRLQEKEWCGVLQEGTRLDHESFFPSLAEIWATMNVFCVLNRSPFQAGPPRDIDWPVIDDPTSGEEQFVLFRGGRLPEEHVAWYRSAIESKQVYRVPMSIATSTHGNKALEFMAGYSYPPEQPMVQYRYHLDREQPVRCKHVNCLEKITKVPGEKEFLLPPYSAFLPTKLEYVEQRVIFDQRQSYYCIDIDIIFDNKAWSDAPPGPVPDDVPLAPWA